MIIKELDAILSQIGQSGDPKKDKLFLDIAKSKFEAFYDLMSAKAKDQERELKLAQKANKISQEHQINKPLPEIIP